ncbi:MAG TPA: WhiB family transcriptional regulator [Mycobacterium sp.]|nr:WhiB family transcriptional regulator [Mycobacterium sp.]
MRLPQQLPKPHADVWHWQTQGRCRGVDTSVFFSPDGERGRARADREQRAKELCRRCPVIAQCRAHALAVGEPFGVWGGLSESDRERLLNPPDSHAHTQHDHEIGRTTYSRKSVV